MLEILHGQVIHADTNKPLASATIVVVHGPGPSPDIAPLTDSGGRFTLNGLSAGEWTLRAYGLHGESGEATTRVSAGSAANIVIQAR